MNIKTILLDTLATKLADVDVNKIVLAFNLKKETYTVMANTATNKPINFEISEAEISTIKAIFIRRIVNAWKAENNKEAYAIYIDIDLQNKEINLYMQNEDNGKLFKFDYL